MLVNQQLPNLTGQKLQEVLCNQHLKFLYTVPSQKRLCKESSHIAL